MKLITFFTHLLPYQLLFRNSQDFTLNCAQLHQYTIEIYLVTIYPGMICLQHIASVELLAKADLIIMNLQLLKLSSNSKLSLKTKHKIWLLLIPPFLLSHCDACNGFHVFAPVPSSVHYCLTLLPPSWGSNSQLPSHALATTQSARFAHRFHTNPSKEANRCWGHLTKFYLFFLGVRCLMLM